MLSAVQKCCAILRRGTERVVAELTKTRPSLPHPPPPPTMLSAHPPSPHLHNSHPTKASLKTWWNHFTFVQRTKKDSHFIREWEKGPCPLLPLASPFLIIPRLRNGTPCLWQTTLRKPPVRLSTDINSKQRGRTLRLGLRARRRRQMVRLPSSCSFSTPASRPLL